MNSEINMKKWLLIIFVSITLISTSIAIVIHYDRKEKERQMTARFDKFMWYYYPYLENISKVSEIYKQMHISLMYDEAENQESYQWQRYPSVHPPLHLSIALVLRNR